MSKAFWRRAREIKTQTFSSSDEEEVIKPEEFLGSGHNESSSSVHAARPTVINPQSMMDPFWLDKKREEETHSKVMDRVKHGIKQVKQKGKLNLSRNGVVSAIPLALMTQDQQHTVIKKYGMYI